jgi:hypothetical protein
MRGHRRRMERPVSGIAKAICWSAAGAAAHRGKASPPQGSRRFDERREQERRRAGRALPRLQSTGLVRKDSSGGLGVARGAGSRGPTPKSGSQGLEGEVAGRLGGQRFLGRITSRSTTPCLMRRRGRSTRRGARSRSRSWTRGVNRDPPGRRPTLCAHEARGCPRKREAGLEARSLARRKASQRPAQRGTSGSARLRARATGPLTDTPFAGRVRAFDPPGAEHPVGARFRESVAGFEQTHRFVSPGMFGRAILRGNAGSS